MAKSDALQRQLDNDEPKCGNCKNWQRILETALGWCNNPKNNTVAGGNDPVIADLAVCSKWEAK